MSIFSWFKSKPVNMESDEVKSLHKLLKAEKAIRKNQADKAKDIEAQLKKDLINEKERVKQRIVGNKPQALIHLRAAERYSESLYQATGPRRAELQAIVDLRLEKYTNLGFEFKGTITETIQWLSTH